MPLTEGWLAQQSEAVTAQPWSQLGRLQRSSGSLGQIQKVEYNGYVFPPALHSTATVEPLYSETGRHRTGTKITIDVTCVLIDQTVTMEDRNAANFQIPSTDTNLASLRTLLNVNGKLLRFELQGLGITAITGDTTQVNQSTVPIVADINKGPKTKVVDWKPITPLAARVTWQVEAIVADCTTGGSVIPYYTDFYGSINTSVNFQGYITRTITGALKVPTPSTITNIPTADQAEAAQTILDKQFPRQVHFNRRYDYTLSSDGGTMEFTITDQEIETDSPWFPGTSEPDVSVTASSGIGENGGGFGMWSMTMSGTIPVNNGVSKVYGFLAAIALIDYYLAKGFTGDLPRGFSESETVDNYTVTDQSYAILTKLSFTDSVYSKNVSFTAEWTLATDFSTLLQASGMFTPVAPDYVAMTYNDGTVEAGVEDDPEADLDPLTFSRWSTSAGITVKPRGIHNFIYTGSDFPQVILCSPKEVATRSPKTEVSQTGPTAENSEPDPLDDLEASKSYLSVDYHVKLVKNNQTFSSSPLADQVVGRNETPAGNGDNKRVLADPGEVLGPVGVQDQYKPAMPEASNAATSNILPHTLRKTGKAKYFVEVTGVIIRAGYRPILPYVGSIGGIPAYEIGQAITTHETLGRGTTTAGGTRTFPIHAMGFVQRFAVQAIPKTLGLQDFNGQAIFDSQSDP